MTKNINGSYAEEWVTAEDTLVLTVDVKDFVPPYNQSKLNHVKHRYPSKPENLIFDRLLISNPESNVRPIKIIPFFTMKSLTMKSE